MDTTPARIPHEWGLPEPISKIVGIFILVIFITLIIRDLRVNSSEYFHFRSESGTGSILHTVCMVTILILFTGLLIGLIW